MRWNCRNTLRPITNLELERMFSLNSWSVFPFPVNTSSNAKSVMPQRSISRVACVNPVDCSKAGCTSLLGADRRRNTYSLACEYSLDRSTRARTLSISNSLIKYSVRKGGSFVFAPRSSDRDVSWLILQDCVGAIVENWSSRRRHELLEEESNVTIVCKVSQCLVRALRLRANCNCVAYGSSELP